jgi:hypothetical protein
MKFWKIFLSCFVFTNLVLLNAFSRGNYRPVKGLEARENKIEEEGTREIVVRKRQTVSYERNSSRNSSLFGFQKCSISDCNYISFGYTNPIKTSVSSTSFEKVENLGFATPIAGKRTGVEMAFGGKFPSPYLGYEIGLMYDFAYFKNTEKDEYGIHAISPSIRLLFDTFPEDDFSFYAGFEGGFAIMDFVYGDKYSVKYAPKVGGLAGISYKMGKLKSYEVFFGYRFINTSKQKFIIEDKTYETNFASHGIHLGLKIKI